MRFLALLGMTLCVICNCFFIGCGKKDKSKRFTVNGSRSTVHGPRYDAITKPSPKVAPYITEHRYYFPVGMHQDLRNVVADIKPAVVSIGTFRSNQGRVEFTNTGSGVIVDIRGYVLTTSETIPKNSSPKVTLFGKDHRFQFDSEIFAQDPGTNLTLLKINSAESFCSMPIGSPATIKLGDWIIAMGSADGLNQKIVPGIVSAMGRNVNIKNKIYKKLIQTDVKLAKGCVGGPFMNTQGELIGINIGKGAAMPIHRAESLLSVLIDSRSQQLMPLVGRQVAQKLKGVSWMGAEVLPVNKTLARQFDIPKRALLVNRVIPNSPADRAGLIRGDAITKIDSRRLHGISEYKRLISRMKPGKTVRLGIIRTGNEMTLDLTLANRPVKIPQIPVQPANIQIDWKGIELSNITPELVRRYDVPFGEQGVVIIGVGDFLKFSGLQRGDLIKSVNTRRVAEINQFLAVVNQAEGRGLVFDISRQGRPLYITVNQ